MRHDVVQRADVVVIGSGGLGAATAFSLVQRGVGDVVVVDKHDIGSQTSPRAAGMAAHARSSDLMVEVMKLAGERLKRFSDDTGGGLPTMTADGRHILGPAPAAEGFFIAGGCNVAGLSASPAIGDLLAAWIVDGAPPLDLSSLSITRFRTTPSEDQLGRDAAWQYRHFYVSA